MKTRLKVAVTVVAALLSVAVTTVPADAARADDHTAYRWIDWE